MIFWQTFLHSLKLPNKQAMFKLNRTGMDITVIYLFILIFIASIPTLVERITNATGPGSDMNLLFLLIYFFIFYYLPLTFIIFAVLSIIAYIGTWLATLLQRKLRFAILWKMSAYSTTIPFIVYMIISFFIAEISSLFLWVFIIYTFILLLKIITVYPRRKVRS